MVLWVTVTHFMVVQFHLREPIFCITFHVLQTMYIHEKDYTERMQTSRSYRFRN